MMNPKNTMVEAVKFGEIPKIIPVDEWVPRPEDIVFRSVKNYIVLPTICQFYGIEAGALDMFNMTGKKCYNIEKMREHTCHYLNYFIKFYDHDKELLINYARIKYLIDVEPLYDNESFVYDIMTYILSPQMIYKVFLMNEDNYNLNLTSNKMGDNLKYTDYHGCILMQISVFMNILIPIVTHFIYKKDIIDSSEYFLAIYDILMDLYPIDVYSKLYETTISIINRSESDHKVLWEKQDIRGKNTTTHSIDTIINMILNIMPKYIYGDNIIYFNYQSIRNHTNYQITDIGYEYNFVPLSGSNRDVDSNSEFDKFESYLVKADEALYLQNKVNCEATMRSIEMLFGPFKRDEIDFYMSYVTEPTGLQKDLIFNIFYKYFGDPVSIRAINKEDYIKLLIAAKKLLISQGMIVLPYIISGKINRYTYRRIVNKKEFSKLVASPYYQQLINKYRADDIEKEILSRIATVLSSEFEYVDYFDEDLHGKIIDVIPEKIGEEMIQYTLLI